MQRILFSALLLFFPFSLSADDPPQKILRYANNNETTSLQSGLHFYSNGTLKGSPGDVFHIYSVLTDTNATCTIRPVAPNAESAYGYRPCDPATFQFKILSEGNCPPIMMLQHSVSNANHSLTQLEIGKVNPPCPSDKANDTKSVHVPVNATLSSAPAGWQGDVALVDVAGLSNRTDVDNAIGSTYTGPMLLPGPEFKSLLANLSYIPGQIPTFFGCVCNASYVSYGCCDARKDNIVHEPARNKIGTLISLDGAPSGEVTIQKNNSQQVNEPKAGTAGSFQNIKRPNSTVSQAAEANSTSHVCSGKCYGGARSCDWQFLGDCECSASWNVFLFWTSGACLPTEQNPNKQHDKRHLRKRHPSVDLGPKLDPNRRIGICNSSYISYACANAQDGIVHEPRSNWLGAVLPEGATEYPPIPQEFLTVHGIYGQPDLGPLEL